MTYEKFSQLVIAKDLTPKDCGEGHWQIRGGKFLVNFYAWKPSFFVNGMNSGRSCGSVRQTLHEAIIATELPPSCKKKSERWRASKSGRKKHLKRYLYRRDPKCYWCTKSLTLRNATLDHVIPISKGGSNSPDNQVLACEPCNQARKNDLPTKTKWQHNERMTDVSAINTRRNTGDAKTTPASD